MKPGHSQNEMCENDKVLEQSYLFHYFTSMLIFVESNPFEQDALKNLTQSCREDKKHTRRRG
jgi:hypothetical protein